MSQSYFFEGPEKKLELVFKSNEISLLDLDTSYWERLVELSQAKILSSIETDTCKAFLLSESSLFVWSDRITLLTCGTTTLIKAAEFLLEEFKNKTVQVFFERKNEYFPVFQKTTALDDMRFLKEKLGGEVLRFGRVDDHHVYLFNKSFESSSSKSNTVELLMYGLQGEFKNNMTGDLKKQEAVISKISEIFKGYKLDPFFFDPEGFSLNALKGDRYATIHVTPQGHENYFSFEMDGADFKESARITEELVDLCKPASYDVILFKDDKEQKTDFKFKNYLLKQKSNSFIESEYDVTYEHYYENESVKVKPVQL